MCEWQDISTAPKDGTWFLAWWPEQERLGPQEAVLATRWDHCEPDGDRFVDVTDTLFDFPTHWMPLPPPPDTDRPDFISGEF